MGTATSSAKGQGRRREQGRGDSAAGQLGGHGLFGDIGLAHVSGQRPGHPANVLHRQGSVQAQLDSHGRHLRRTGKLAGVALAQYDLGRVARGQIQQRETDRRDAQEQQRQRGQPAGQVCSHAGVGSKSTRNERNPSLVQADAMVKEIEVGGMGVEPSNPFVDSVHQIGVGHRQERGFSSNDVQRPAGYLFPLLGV